MAGRQLRTREVLSGLRSCTWRMLKVLLSLWHKFGHLAYALLPQNNILSTAGLGTKGNRIFISVSLFERVPVSGFRGNQEERSHVGGYDSKKGTHIADLRPWQDIFSRQEDTTPSCSHLFQAHGLAASVAFFYRFHPFLPGHFSGVSGGVAPSAEPNVQVIRFGK